MADLIDIIERRQDAWTVEQLAELLQCSSRHLYKLIKAGRLPAFRIGTLVRLNPRTTAEWLRTRDTGMQPPRRRL